MQKDQDQMQNSFTLDQAMDVYVCISDNFVTFQQKWNWKLLRWVLTKVGPNSWHFKPQRCWIHKPLSIVTNCCQLPSLQLRSCQEETTTSTLVSWLITGQVRGKRDTQTKMRLDFLRAFCGCSKLHIQSVSSFRAKQHLRSLSFNSRKRHAREDLLRHINQELQ